MNVELINTGTELLLGRTLNTHQQWIGTELAACGYRLTRQVTVPDVAEAIESAAREALARATWVIVTGGLGPTSDDLTRERVAHLLGVPLQPDPEVLARLLEFYQTRQRTVPDRVLRQADVPLGAIVIHNQYGTAPGLVMSVPAGRFQSGAGWLAMLPGPPRELRPMFRDQLLPLLTQFAPLPAPFTCRTFRCTGIGESHLEDCIRVLLNPLVEAGLQIAYCARPGEVDLRLEAQGPDAERVIGDACRIVVDRVGTHIFGDNDLELEVFLVRQLAAMGRTLSTAESCTGGLLAHRLTNVPGASEVFRGGWVTYSNRAKQTCLAIDPESINTHGAVSEPIARAMAEGARRLGESDYALAITGIAGPGGGTIAKPVGTVFIALAGPDRTRVINPHNPWDRPTFKQVTTQQALDLLRRELGPLKASAPDNLPGAGAD